MHKNSKHPLLSICIPTFNREKPLKNLLDSILNCLELQPELIHQTEIVISDNHSSDRTEDIARTFEPKLHRIVFAKNPQNMGYAANINKAVSIASGKYCWLMGSDETLTSSSLISIFNEISHNTPDLIVGSAVTNGHTRAFFGEKSFSRQIENQKSINDIIYKSSEISALFAFLSTIIIKKEFWTQAQLTNFELMHPYTHTIRTFKILANNRVKFSYLSDPLVSTGSEPNEYNSSLHKHLLLDLKTFDYIFRNIIIPPDEIKKHLLNLFKKQYTPRRLIFCRATANPGEWKVVTELFHNLGFEIDPTQRIYDKLFAFFYRKFKAARNSWKQKKKFL